MSSIVLGLGFGDEGKGLVTDWVASKAERPLVVRFSGGHQAGHTVVVGDKRHIFSSFGSGTMRGAATYWSKNCTVDPIAMMNEARILIEKGFTPQILIDGKCPITTPYDMLSNRSAANFSGHGSVGVGFGTTLLREERHYSLLFEDMFHDWAFRTKLEAIRKHYVPDQGYGIDLSMFVTAWHELIHSPWVTLCYGMPVRGDNIHYGDVIFEGSQGLLLDQNFGFFPNVTRANTGTKNAYEMHTAAFFDSVYLVTRAYQTRHGNGPMSTEGMSMTIKDDPNETNRDHPYQGPFRRGVLDVNLLEYAIMKDEYLRRNVGDCTLVVTCLDHLDHPTFTYKGNRVGADSKDDFVKKIRDILGVKNALMSSSPDSENMRMPV